MQIQINYIDTDYRLEKEKYHKKWLFKIIDLYDKDILELQYNFCTDKYLYSLNKKYLNHNTYTDIITFDTSFHNYINGDIYISIDRVKENAFTYNEIFNKELVRVMSHGLLHLIGYKDKTKEEKNIMKIQENICINLFYKMFHVEHKKYV